MEPGIKQKASTVKKDVLKCISKNSDSPYLSVRKGKNLYLDNLWNLSFLYKL